MKNYVEILICRNISKSDYVLIGYVLNNSDKRGRQLRTINEHINVLKKTIMNEHGNKPNFCFGELPFVNIGLPS